MHRPDDNTSKDRMAGLGPDETSTNDELVERVLQELGAWSDGSLAARTLSDRLQAMERDNKWLSRTATENAFRARAAEQRVTELEKVIAHGKTLIDEWLAYERTGLL